jgi:hypothetical protein
MTNEHVHSPTLADPNCQNVVSQSISIPSPQSLSRCVPNDSLLAPNSAPTMHDTHTPNPQIRELCAAHHSQAACFQA